MAEAPDNHPPLGRADSASLQLERAARFICAHHRLPWLSIVAHSWGSIVAGRLAGLHPELVERLVLFGPIARRESAAVPATMPAWRLITIEEQWKRFVADLPAGEAAVLLPRQFDDWAERYLDTDRQARGRSPAAVKTPTGPLCDIAEAWAGRLAYDPGLVTCPVAIIRGEWDSLCDDADARWLLEAFARAGLRRDVKIGRGTHLMHLESGRHAVYRETETFLLGRDMAAG